jgi:hypothetical protein
MPGSDDLMMRVYAAMAQKERELISERTRAALGASKAGGARLGVIGAIGRRRALTVARRLSRAVWRRSGRRTGCCSSRTGCGRRASRRDRRLLERCQKAECRRPGAGMFGLTRPWGVCWRGQKRNRFTPSTRFRCQRKVRLWPKFTESGTAGPPC